LRPAQKGNITGGTGLFEITCRGATSFVELDQARNKLVTTVGPKQTTQYLAQH